MINIIFVDSGGGNGGSMAYLYSFLKYIDRSRICPIVVMYNFSEAAFVRKIKELGIKVKFLSTKARRKSSDEEGIKNRIILKAVVYFRFMLKFFLEYFPLTVKMIWLIRRTETKIVLLGSEVDFNIPAVLGAKFSRVVCIVRKSGTGTVRNNLIRRIFCHFVDVFIASSNAEEEGHKKKKLSFRKMKVVYEGIDLNSFYGFTNVSKIRNEFCIPGEHIVISSISRLEIGKGHDDLLQAAALVIKKFPKAVFIIIGDDFDCEKGSIRKQLEKTAKNLGIEHNIIFTGWRDDVPEILQAVDIFVHCPNRWLEGMGIATLEAMACGKPVIVTNNCGLAETTIDEYNGFVIPVGDHAKLAEKILVLINNNSLRDRMGKNSRARAEQVFDIKKTVKETEKIFYDSLR